MAKITIPQDFMEKFSNNEELLIFLYLLLHADDSGDICISLRQLSAAIDVPLYNVRVALKKMEFAQQITQQLAQQITHITICNYKTYNKSSHSVSHSVSHTNSHSETTVEEDHREVLFKERMKEKFPYVAQMKRPLTRKNWDELIRDYTAEQITDVLSAMDNFKQLNSKYVYAKGTALNWLKRRHGKQ